MRWSVAITLAYLGLARRSMAVEVLATVLARLEATEEDGLAVVVLLPIVEKCP